jgi:hypothetical protein
MLDHLNGLAKTRMMCCLTRGMAGTHPSGIGWISNFLMSMSGLYWDLIRFWGYQNLNKKKRNRTKWNYVKSY